ncbi:hypothetical protein UCMB321_3434 [Pseudomonas batumici]|uniref:Uncharacterized protein n=1 Tax=Pseudomonas batumici TaxID=226910 RepID=A0A0C2EAS5_9PSED|nr:hypothetical protein UCMB321_3434 [Pseudomonas batumici]
MYRSGGFGTGQSIVPWHGLTGVFKSCWLFGHFIVLRKLDGFRHLLRCGNGIAGENIGSAQIPLKSLNTFPIKLSSKPIAA